MFYRSNPELRKPSRAGAFGVHEENEEKIEPRKGAKIARVCPDGGTQKMETEGDEGRGQERWEKGEGSFFLTESRSRVRNMEAEK